MSLLHTTVLSGLMGVMLVVSNAFSAEPPLSTETTSQTSTIPFYHSGGVGDQSQMTLEKTETTSMYNVKLTTAFDSGHYLANVDVKVTDKDGQILLSTVTEGPLFYIDLDPGTYTISATYDNVVKQQKVQVSENSPLREIVFHWKATEPVNG